MSRVRRSTDGRFWCALLRLGLGKEGRSTGFEQTLILKRETRVVSVLKDLGADKLVDEPWVFETRAAYTIEGSPAGKRINIEHDSLVLEVIGSRGQEFYLKDGELLEVSWN